MYHSDDNEIKAIERVLKSKKLFRYQGKDVETECSLFEKNFSRYLNTKNSLLLSSGTNALVTALFSLGISEGDEVLIPAYTFFATAAAVIELRAIPVVVNVDEYLSFESKDLENKLTPKTKALIAVHMDGYPCDMEFLSTFCAKNSLQLIEDTAQAVGGNYKGKKLGSIGAFGCYSFNVDKIISCGEGGAITTNNAEYFQKAFLYHDTCNQFGPTCKDNYTIEKFSGKSMRVSEIQGAMINVQLEKLEFILEQLKKRKRQLDTHLKEVGFKLLPTYDNEGECHTTSRVLCDDAAQNGKLVIELNKLMIKANSPMVRPAHQVWQWHHLLPKEKVQTKFDFLPSIDILSRILLIHVSLEGTDNEWIELIQKIRR